MLFPHPPAVSILYMVWMRGLLLSAFLLPASVPLFPQDKPSHGLKCPTECRACTDSVRRALDFLASRQVENGCIPAHIAPLEYVRTDRNVTHVFTTTLAGLSFLAEGSTASKGPYRNCIALAARFLRDVVADLQASTPRRVGGGGGPIYSAALCLQFFVHLHGTDKEAGHGKIVRLLVDFLVDAIGEGVGVSVWKKGKDEGTLWFVSGVTALLNSTILALSRAREAGFEVPDRVWKIARDYYAKYFEPDGSIKYDQHNMFPEEPRPGRTMAALMALKALGADGDPAFKAAHKYVRANVERPNSHHTPTLHYTLGAHAFRSLGDDEWKRFVDAHFQKLQGRQKEDGSLDKICDHDPKLLMTPNDTAWGGTYSTANFALILQVPTGRVRFMGKTK